MVGVNLLTIEDLAAQLQIPVATLRDWRQDGTGPPAVKVGRAVRWRQETVDRWLIENEEAA